jgi:hypothetical protein
VENVMRFSSAVEIPETRALSLFLASNYGEVFDKLKEGGTRIPFNACLLDNSISHMEI